MTRDKTTFSFKQSDKTNFKTLESWAKNTYAHHKSWTTDIIGDYSVIYAVNDDKQQLRLYDPAIKMNGIIYDSEWKVANKIDFSNEKLNFNYTDDYDHKGDHSLMNRTAADFLAQQIRVIYLSK